MRVLGSDGATPRVEDHLVPRPGPRPRTPGARRGRSRTPHVGAKENNDDGGVEHHDHLRQEEEQAAGVSLCIMTYCVGVTVGVVIQMCVSV